MTSSHSTPHTRPLGGMFTVTRSRAFVSMALAWLFTAAALHAEPSSSLTHQGRLTDGSGTPLNGVYTLNIGLYVSAVGGLPVATETRSVDVVDGLFSVNLDTLGKASIYSDNDSHNDNWYFGISVGADAELLPRLRIGSVPFAHVASGLDGSIDKDGNGTADIGTTIESKVSRNVLKTYFETGDVPTQSQFTVLLDSDGLSLRLEARDQFSNRQSSTTQFHKPDSLSLLHALDHNGDSDDDGTIETIVAPTASSVAIKTKGTGADKNRVISTATPDSASQEVSVGADGSLFSKAKGIVVVRGAGGGGAGGSAGELRLSTDDDADGDLEAEVTSSATATTAVVKTKTKSNQSNDRTSVEITSGGNAPTEGSSILMTDDSDGDGFGDAEISSSVSASTAVVKTKTKSNQSNDRSSVTISSNSNTPSEGSSIALGEDSDGDGFDDNSAVTKLALSQAKLSISLNFGGSKRTSLEQTTTLDSILESEQVYDNGVPAMSYTAKAGKTGKAKRCDVTDPFSTSSSRFYQSSDSLTEDEEVISGGQSLSYTAKAGKTGKAKRCDVVEPGSSSSRSESQDADSTTESQSYVASGSVTLSYKATQGKTGKAKRVAYTPGGGVTSTEDEDCDDIESSEARSYTSGGVRSESKHQSDASAGRFTATRAAAVATLEAADDLLGGQTSTMKLSSVGVVHASMNSQGVGYVSSSMGVGVPAPSNPIEHSSGAHLTAGGVWTNASDENLKENFEKVNGEEILEKVAELPISRWNYKNERDEITHIGPTAQDFKAAFQVGGNDKSISTIDPSGVALVAIKELKKENDQLRKELNELRMMIEKMKK